MIKLIPHLIFSAIYIFNIVELSLTKDQYETCAAPINDWYMGWMCFIFTFHFLTTIMSLNCFSSTIIGFIAITLFPLSFLFIIIWNVLGTYYTIKILSAPDRSKCMSTGTLIFVIFVLLLVYLIYYYLFKWIVKTCQKLGESKKKKDSILKSIQECYLLLSSESVNALSNKEKSDIRDKLNLYLKENLDIINTTKMQDFEKEILTFYFQSDGQGNINLTQPNNFGEDSKSFLITQQAELKESKEHIIQHDKTKNQELKEQKKPNQSERRKSLLRGERLSNLGQTQRNVTESILGMIGLEVQQPSEDNQLTLIQENTNEESDDCIICFCPLENSADGIKLKCDHNFHKECLFEWLIINPTCPMCRAHFRPQIIQEMISHLNSFIQDTQLENA